MRLVRSKCKQIDWRSLTDRLPPVFCVDCRRSGLGENILTSTIIRLDSLYLVNSGLIKWRTRGHEIGGYKTSNLYYVYMISEHFLLLFDLHLIGRFNKENCSGSSFRKCVGKCMSILMKNISLYSFDRTLWLVIDCNVYVSQTIVFLLSTVANLTGKLISNK